MGRRKNPNPSTRYRFSIPDSDAAVLKWMQKQSNLSSSIHVMIRAFIRQYGYTDAMCVEFGVSQRSVGRPPKQVQMMFDTMNMEFSGQSDEDTRPEIGQETAQKPAESLQTPDVQPTPVTKEKAKQEPEKAPVAPVEAKPAPKREPEDDSDGFELPSAGVEKPDESYRDTLTDIFASGRRAPGGINYGVVPDLGMPGDDE